MANEILDVAHVQWKNKQKAGRCLAALMMYGVRKIEAPASLNKQAPDNGFETYFGFLVKQHRVHISRDNHGIKEKNILGVFLPIGVLENELDPVWLGTMNSFGVQRGIVAHGSVLVVQTPPDPQVMKQTVSNILQGLQALEQIFRKLKRQ
jgi:hypothetical protein